MTMTTGMNTSGPQRMNYNHYNDPLNFIVVLLSNMIE